MSPAAGGGRVQSSIAGSAPAAAYAQRFEVSGETVFCYVKDAQPLLVHLHTQSGLRYLHRPSNLEDVFLKLTGREMRE